MIGTLLDLADGGLATVLTDHVRVAGWAVGAGVASMWIYAVTSPQARLKALAAETAEASRALQSYDGEFAGAVPLIRRSLSAAFRRLGLAVVPSLLAGLPMIVLLIWVDGRFHEEALPFGPEWARGYLAYFIVVATVASLAAKRILRAA